MDAGTDGDVEMVGSWGQGGARNQKKIMRRCQGKLQMSMGNPPARGAEETRRLGSVLDS
ncbi:hypothetical protein PIB30_093203 [Stylosanthes scabra]|uniref:Uncharacterized protein n=1 Tax=Stylosanthes scabra TaxID=79078 RepID=A0ABU6ZTW8_9FABA|nr:hypothetical protein [Stylosanthes scabra]